jgi:hypothetical protein
MAAGRDVSRRFDIHLDGYSVEMHYRARCSARTRRALCSTPLPAHRPIIHYRSPRSATSTATHLCDGGHRLGGHELRQATASGLGIGAILVVLGYPLTRPYPILVTTSINGLLLAGRFLGRYSMTPVSGAQGV